MLMHSHPPSPYARTVVRLKKDLPFSDGAVAVQGQPKGTLHSIPVTEDQRGVGFCVSVSLFSLEETGALKDNTCPTQPRSLTNEKEESALESRVMQGSEHGGFSKIPMCFMSTNPTESQLNAFKNPSLQL